MTADYKDVIYRECDNRIYIRMLYNYVVVSTGVERPILWFHVSYAAKVTVVGHVH
jgi:hypothetical protein